MTQKVRLNYKNLVVVAALAGLKLVAVSLLFANWYFKTMALGLT